MSKPKYKVGASIKLNYPVCIWLTDYFSVTVPPGKEGRITKVSGRLYPWGFIAAFDLELQYGSIITVYKEFDKEADKHDFELQPWGI